MKPRYYQTEAIKAVLETWALGTQATLAVLPTGTGKTFLFAKIIETVVGESARVLVLAHREELLQQASDEIEAVTGLKCALEKADSCCIGSWFNVVTGSVQSLQSEKRLDKFTPDYFTHIIIDESHRILAQSYRRILNYFPDAKILGVTATADRGDKRNLGEVFDTIAYQYSLLQAIKDGFLVPIKARTLPLKIELSGVKTQAGDYQAAALGSALDPYLEEIANEMVTHCSDRKTMVFLPLIATSQKFCEILNKKGLPAVEINGESPDRHQKRKDFENDKYKVLCNSMLYTEGYNCPSIDCIIVLRPTKIRMLYTQMIGRGTRIHPGKDHLLILDFLWHTNKHDLCRPAHLICENDDIVGRVSEILAENTSVDIDLLSDLAPIENNAIEEREESLRKELEAQKDKKNKLVDVLQYEHSIEDKAKDYEPDAMNLREQIPASDAQLSYIENNGINPLSVTCQGHASTIIGTIKKRRESGLSTPLQIRKLEQKGFQNVGQWTFDQGKNMIARIAMNKWNVPNGVDAETYKPK